MAAHAHVENARYVMDHGASRVDRIHIIRVASGGPPHEYYIRSAAQKFLRLARSCLLYLNQKGEQFGGEMHTNTHGPESLNKLSYYSQARTCHVNPSQSPTLVRSAQVLVPYSCKLVHTLFRTSREPTTQTTFRNTSQLCPSQPTHTHPPLSTKNSFLLSSLALSDIKEQTRERRT